jgi:hypothetical protein
LQKEGPVNTLTPELEPVVGDGFAGLNIIDGDIDVQRNTCLILSDISAYILARDV